MGKKIYIGNMLQEVQNSMAALQTDMATMSGDMASMVSELIALKETMGQSVNEVIISSEEGNNIYLLESETETVTGDNLLGTFKSVGTGSITIRIEHKCNSPATIKLKIGYSINGGSIIYTAPIVQLEDYKLSDIIIAIQKNDVLKIYVQSSNGKTTLGTNSAIIYKLKDVINEGVLIKV